MNEETQAPEDRFDACIPIILEAEGGFVNDPRDPGGATNHGITLRTLQEWRASPVTVNDVRRLSADESAEIYRAKYWEMTRCGDLPPGIDLMVFDFAVNAGSARSARMLQEALGVIPDGQIGPKTLAAVAKADPRALIAQLAYARERYYRKLPTFQAFGRGWLARLKNVRARALDMLG